MLVGVIVACEVGFWVLLLAGLAARYLLHLPRVGAVLLFSAPLVDLVLLVATVADLRGGGTATTAHGLAAVYLGCSVGFGLQMLRWADVRFTHRYAGGPPPRPKPSYGAEHAACERAMWLRHLLAWAVGCGLLLLAIVVIGDPDRTGALQQTALAWTLVLVIDAVISWSYSLWPKRARPGNG